MLTVENITSALKEILPSQAFILVKERRGAFDGKYIMIYFAASKIYGDAVYRPQSVSLSYELTDGALTTQCYGGDGGGFLLIDPKDKLYCYSSVKIPFRSIKGKQTVTAKDDAQALARIKGFAANWVKLMKENIDVLSYRDKVDYQAFLAS